MLSTSPVEDALRSTQIPHGLQQRRLETHLLLMLSEALIQAVGLRRFPEQANETSTCPAEVAEAFFFVVVILAQFFLRPGQDH